MSASGRGPRANRSEANQVVGTLRGTAVDVCICAAIGDTRFPAHLTTGPRNVPTQCWRPACLKLRNLLSIMGLQDTQRFFIPVSLRDHLDEKYLQDPQVLTPRILRGPRPALSESVLLGASRRVRWPRGLRRRFANAAEDQKTGRNLHGFGPFFIGHLVGVGCRMMDVGLRLGTLLGTIVVRIL